MKAVFGDDAGKLHELKVDWAYASKTSETSCTFSSELRIQTASMLTKHSLGLTLFVIFQCAAMNAVKLHQRDPACRFTRTSYESSVAF